MEILQRVNGSMRNTVGLGFLPVILGVTVERDTKTEQEECYNKFINKIASYIDKKKRLLGLLDRLAILNSSLIIENLAIDKTGLQEPHQVNIDESLMNSV